MAKLSAMVDQIAQATCSASRLTLRLSSRR